MACHLARAPVALAFWPVVQRLPPEPALAALLAINASLAALSQFATPAELALLPDLVGRERLMAANALLQLSTLAAEGIGIILLGPLLFRLGHLSLMGMLGAGLYLLALVLVIPLPRGRIEIGRGDRPWLAALAADLRGGWRTIAGDPLLRRVTAQVTLGGHCCWCWLRCCRGWPFVPWGWEPTWSPSCCCRAGWVLAWGRPLWHGREDG